jgi:hypothetical protein
MLMRTIARTVVVLFCLAFAGAALSETYYVRTDGNNINAGLGNSSAEAWRTIQYAADNVAPGDTVLVDAGTYAEDVTINSQGTADLPISFIGSGDVYVSSIKFPGSSVFSGTVLYHMILDNFIFDGDVSESDYGVYLYAAWFVTIRNSTFRDFRGSYVTNPWGTYWMPRVGIRFQNNAWASSYYLKVENSLFANNDYGVTGQMLVSSEFLACEFTGNTYGFAARNWGTRYTTFARSIFDNNETGIYLAGVYWHWLKTHHNTVYRSIFTYNGNGVLIGDHNATTYNGASYANRVINSNFYRNQNAGILVNTNFSGVNDWMGPEWFDQQGQTFTNNVFLENGTYGLNNAVNQTIFTDYSLAFGNGIASGNNALFSEANFSLGVSPLFVDALNGDFSLGAGSPARDAGNPDWNDDPDVVDGMIDMGAIEAGVANGADIIAALADETGGIPDSYLNNKNNSLPLSKKLYVALQMIIKGDEETDPAKADNYYHAALQKLSKDILPKTDGCASSGAPDSNDWILDCGTQADFYDPIVQTINMLEAM